MTILIGARNILCRPTLHRQQVHPKLDTQVACGSSKGAAGTRGATKKSMKRTVPIADFFQGALKKGKCEFPSSFFIKMTYLNMC